MTDSRYAQKLRDPNRNVRIRAVVAIGADDRTEALTLLSRVLDDKDERVRWTVVQIASEWNDPAAIPLLIRALDDKDARVRIAAARALGDLRDPVAIEPLFDQIADSDAQVSAKCRSALRGFGTAVIPSLRQRFVDSRPVVRDAAADLLVDLAPQTIESVCQLLQSKEEEVAAAAAETLQRIAQRCPSVALHSAVPLLQRRIQPWWNRAGSRNSIYQEAIAAIEGGTAGISNRPIPVDPATVLDDRPIPSDAPGGDPGNLPVPDRSGSDPHE